MTPLLSPNLDREIWEVEKSLLHKEFIRFITFAEFVDNAIEATQKLLQLQV